MPEGVSPGDEFELVCTFRLKESGTVCLTQFGETEMQDDKAEARPDYSDHVAEMRGAMTES